MIGILSATDDDDVDVEHETALVWGLGLKIGNTFCTVMCDAVAACTDYARSFGPPNMAQFAAQARGALAI